MWMVKVMERQKTELNYGNGFINVYLPREDGFDQTDLVAPSPIFTVDSIYKFSDQVLNDRHLFLGKKTLHHTQFDADDADSTGMNSGRSSVLDERDGNLKTVKLSLDASQQGVNYRSRRRFNERLSAYVPNIRKTNETFKVKKYSKSATTPRSVGDYTSRSNITPRASTRGDPGFAKRNYQTPVLRLGTPRRGTSVEKALNSNTEGLPPLSPLRTVTRQKSYFVKDETLWFPGSALKGIDTKPNTLPLRPSSRQYNVWRQSTEMLLNEQIGRFSPSRITWSNHPNTFVQKTFV